MTRVQHMMRCFEEYGFEQHERRKACSETIGMMNYIEEMVQPKDEAEGRDIMFIAKKLRITGMAFWDTKVTKEAYERALKGEEE